MSGPGKLWFRVSLNRAILSCGIAILLPLLIAVHYAELAFGSSRLLLCSTAAVEALVAISLLTAKVCLKASAMEQRQAALVAYGLSVIDTAQNG